MAYTPLEWLALVFAALVLVKIAVILVKPELWHRKVVKPVFLKGKATALVYFILAGGVLYILLQELTIVQVFASALFTGLLVGATMALYQEEVAEMSESVLQAGMEKSLPALVIWLLLVLWVLYAVLA